MSPNYKTDSTIFASAWHEAVFCSNDGGNTWNKYSKGITSNFQANQRKEPHFRDLRISKTLEKDKTIFLGGYDGLFKSTDGGRAWKQLDTLPLRLIIGLALSPSYKDDSTVAITTYVGGAYKTTDEQKIAWTAINKDLKQSRLGDIVFSPNYHSDNTIFTTAENHLLKSTDRGKTWKKIKLSNQYWGLSGLVNTGRNKLSSWLPKPLSTVAKPKVKPWSAMIAISPNFADDNTIYFGTRTGLIFRSVNGGLHSSIVWKRIGKEVKSLIISPNFSSDKTLYTSVFGGEGVYKSVDRGATWHPASNGLAFIKEGIELAISPYYKVDKTVIAGTVGGLFKTTDGGKNWIKLAGSTYGNDGYIKAIAISPNYQSDQTFVINVEGRGLFKNVNSGMTFAQIGTDLIDNNHSLSNMYKFPPASVPIKFSPSYSIDKTIYGSSAEELFQSTDGGNTWKIITIPIRYEDSKNNIGERLIQLFNDLVGSVVITVVAVVIGLGAYCLLKKKLKHVK